VIIRSDFRPARGLANPHLQTLLPVLPFVRSPQPAAQREIITLPDGDTTAADWAAPTRDSAPPDAPVMIVLHGLEGSSESSYARWLLHEAAAIGWRAAVLHFRDCGGHPNRLPRRYHAGDTDDLAHFLGVVEQRYPRAPRYVAGFSLGGNALLKYLGQAGTEARCDRAVAVSVPFELQKASDRLSGGFSRVYQWHLMRNMRNAMRRKFDPRNAPFDFERAERARDFETFDDIVTAPLHGFSGKDDYYSSCSSRQFLRGIERETLIIHAEDDPFMSPDIVPGAAELSPAVTLELSRFGGHVGFITGDAAGKLGFWLPGRIINFMGAGGAARTGG
jgi:predicted alpha/beta-fold hydrolase